MSPRRLFPALLGCHLLILIFWIGTGYLRSDPTFLAGLGLLPAVTLLRQPGRGSGRFGLLAVVCAGLALAVPARTFHFLALAFSALFVFENWKGRINLAPVLVLLLLTAVAKTMGIILGFSIRLELSSLAARVLQLAGRAASAEGNVIVLEGRHYSVDPACMGLQMVDISFLFCFFLLALFERRSGKILPAPTLLTVLLATAGLNVVFNFLRILLLVVGNIAPETVGHDLAGLAGLVLYVFLPLCWGLRLAYDRWGILAKAQVMLQPRPYLPGAGLRNRFHLPFLMTLLVTGLCFTQKMAGSDHLGVDYPAVRPKGLPGFCSPQPLIDGVVKYSTDSTLIYVKPIRGFYSTEHTPLICWLGSGYEFGQVWEARCGQTPYYTGVLQKGGEQLYTAWWYDNGETQTISQTRWRWLDMAGKAGFSLVNVTARDRAVLDRQVQQMLQ